MPKIAEPSALPPEFWIGADQFNQGEFYACHDTFEAIWMETLEDRRFYQGLLQIAVGLYHLSNLNWQGAVTLLGEGVGRLRPYLPDHETVDVALVRGQAQAILEQLQTSGPAAVAESASGLGLSPGSQPSGAFSLPTIQRLAE